MHEEIPGGKTYRSELGRWKDVEEGNPGNRTTWERWGQSPGSKALMLGTRYWGKVVRKFTSKATGGGRGEACVMSDKGEQAIMDWVGDDEVKFRCGIIPLLVLGGLDWELDRISAEVGGGPQCLLGNGGHKGGQVNRLGRIWQVFWAKERSCGSIF